MNKIKYIFNTINEKEFCLTMTGNYMPSICKIDLQLTQDNDLILTIDSPDSTEIFFGRIIDKKIYFARHQYVSKNVDIDYYDEFFSTGQELKFAL